MSKFHYSYELNDTYHDLVISKLEQTNGDDFNVRLEEFGFKSNYIPEEDIFIHSKFANTPKYSYAVFVFRKVFQKINLNGIIFDIYERELPIIVASISAGDRYVTKESLEKFLENIILHLPLKELEISEEEAINYKEIWRRYMPRILTS